MTTHEKMPDIHIVLFYVGDLVCSNNLFKGFIFFNKRVDGGRLGS